jgi:hypothetical protein
MLWTTLIHLFWSRDVLVATRTNRFHFGLIFGPSVRHIFYTSVLAVVDKQVSLLDECRLLGYGAVYIL